MFTPDYSLLQRSIPLLPLPTLPASPPGPPPGGHPTLPATRPCPPPHQACHHTLPTTAPCPPPHPACLPSLAVLTASSATTASLALLRACAVLVLLQRLCWCGASQRATPSNILRTPSKVLCTRHSTPSKILHTSSKILCIPSNILLKSYL